MRSAGLTRRLGRLRIWACGTVKRVAHSPTDRASKRAQKVLPAGAVLWAWEADPEYDESAGEKWLHRSRHLQVMCLFRV